MKFTHSIAIWMIFTDLILITGIIQLWMILKFDNQNHPTVDYSIFIDLLMIKIIQLIKGWIFSSKY